MADPKPYRLEWRASLTTQWTLITTLDNHPGDLETFVKSQEGWSWTGQWRVIVQHVIETTGIVGQ